MSSSLVFPFHVELDVRGYELDPWQHVNNAVYLNWLEHARWEMARHEPMQALFMACMPVVRHAELDFRAETRLGDRLRVATWPRSLGETSFVLGQSITIVAADDEARRGKLALVAKMVFACFAPGRGKQPVPEALRALFPATDPGNEAPDQAL